MTKQNQKRPAGTPDELFIIGLDDTGKPRGARFAETRDPIVNAGLDLGLSCVLKPTAAFSAIAMKLPEGRMYASGKAFIPNIKRDLYDKLVVALAGPEEAGTEIKIGGVAGSPKNITATATTIACVSPMTSGLPRSWDSIGVGHMVLVHESPDDGWWEAVVIKREDKILTLRFRDYPKQPTFIRHLNMVALVNPGPT